MTVRIEHDTSAPTASVELAIRRPLPDFDLEEVQVTTPREVDPILASQGFKDLLDEARGILEEWLGSTGLEIAQLTGAAPAMFADARKRVANLVERLRSALGLS